MNKPYRSVGGLQPLGTFSQTGETLARMIAKGLCSLNDLDHRPPGSVDLPMPHYQNIARDWISGNRNRWAEIKNEYGSSLEPAIELVSPKDLPTPEKPLPF